MDQACQSIPTPILPTEVCERIIDKIGDDIFKPCAGWSQPRANALSSCALVARSWLPRARLYLFNTVHLDSLWRTETFLQALTLTPILGQRVRYLFISSNSKESAHKWIHRILLFLPPLTPHVHSVVLINLPLLHRSFVTLASRFTLVKSLELISLDAQSFGEIIQLVNRYPYLERLSILDCKWRVPSRYFSGKQHNITNLTLWNRPNYQKEALSWALASRSTSKLRLFSCFISIPSTLDLEEDNVLATCRSTLQEMAIVGSISARGSLLTDQRALRRLTLICDREEAVLSMSQVTLFAPRSLEDIFLKMLEGSNLGKLFEESKKARWKEIDRALCGDRFTSLRSLVISSTKTIPRRDIHDVFQVFLPELYKRGILWWSDNIDHVLIAPASISPDHEPPLRWEFELS